jgi:hypothetical protein
MSKSSITAIADELEHMPDRIEEVRKTVEDWRDYTIRQVRRHPGRSILGAFAVGYVIAKLGRYL